MSAELENKENLKKEAERLFRINEKYGLLKDLVSAEFNLVNYKYDYIDSQDGLFLLSTIERSVVNSTTLHDCSENMKRDLIKSIREFKISCQKNADNYLENINLSDKRINELKVNIKQYYPTVTIPMDEK